MLTPSFSVGSASFLSREVMCPFLNALFALGRAFVDNPARAPVLVPLQGFQLGENGVQVLRETGELVPIQAQDLGSGLEDRHPSPDVLALLTDVLDELTAGMR